MNYYADLGIARDATPEQVKDAWLRAKFRHHPDRHHGDPAGEAQAAEKFRSARIAYEVLSDPTQRRKYDEQGFADPEALAAIMRDLGDDIVSAHAAWEAGQYPELAKQGVKVATHLASLWLKGKGLLRGSK